MKQLQKYVDEGAHILVPFIKMSGLSEFHELVLDVLLLDPDPKGDDVYVQEKAYKNKPAKLALTAKALARLGICASVEWDPKDTRITYRDENYVAYSAVGYVNKADGTRVGRFAEGDIDMKVERNKIEDAMSLKVETWLDPDNDKGKWFRQMSKASQDGYVRHKIAEQVNFKDTHKQSLAATKARSRVLRDLLGTKSTYTVEDLEKPFVMPRVILRPDYSDPEVKKLMLAGAIQSVMGVFGAPPARQIEGQAPIETEFRTVGPDSGAGGEDPDLNREPDGDAPTEEEIRGIRRQEFIESDTEGQRETLKTLKKQKAYDNPAITDEAIDKFSEPHRLAFYDKLDAMPDAEGSSDDPFSDNYQDDDIPF